MPDSLSPAAFWGEPTRWPALDDRFLPPPDFVWGSFTARDGAQLRWGHLPVAGTRAQCVLVGGFGEFIEKQVETVRDLAARGVEVWCLDWRGQGGSIRPRRLPTRPRPRNFDRDAADLAAFTAAKLIGPMPRVALHAPASDAVRGGGPVLADARPQDWQGAAHLAALYYRARAGRRAWDLLYSGGRKMAAEPDSLA
jgi:hypothetical protein